MRSKVASINTRTKPQLPPQTGAYPPQIFEPSNTLRTHEGAPAALISPELQLRRSVCSCLLWEDTFYESGQEIAQRIAELVAQVPVKTVCELAYDVRTHFNLRHVPLLIMAAVAAPGRGGSRLIGETLASVIQRPDELSEFVAIYAKVWGVKPNAVKKRLSAQVKKGLAAAFGKFDRYQLAKYFSKSGEKGAGVKARDVMFLSHPKPGDEEKAELFRRMAAKEAIVEGGADTWEVALSTGQNKRETFERQLREQKLSYLALLRNLRNMIEAGVDEELIWDAIVQRRGARRVLPFRYVAAARACPQMAGAIDLALLEAISQIPALPGRTVVLVDVSGSMNSKLSARSDLTRMDAAAALASIIHGDVRVFTFSERIVEVTPLPLGISGIDDVIASQEHGGTYLGRAIDALSGDPVTGPLESDWNLLPHYHPMVRDRTKAQAVEMDRLIVITDEQSHDHVNQPQAAYAYMINVASERNGVGYGGRWIHIDGFSEQVIRFIHEFESLPAEASGN